MIQRSAPATLRSALATRAAQRALSHLVRRGLRGVWLRGDPPAGAFVWAANHHSWWDPFLAAITVRHLGRTTSVLMLQSSLDRYPVARALGAFGTAEQRHGLDHLRQGRVLVIYPEGDLRPPATPGTLAPGAAWFANRAAVPLCAVAGRVLVRGHQSPEAYLWLAQVPPAGTLSQRTAQLARYLGRHLDELDQLQATSDPRRPLPGFTRIVRGRQSWDERMDRMSRWRSWSR